MAEFRVSNFERGMTDEYINGPENGGQLYNNIIITKNKKPISRDGSELYDSDLDVLPTGNNRIQYIKYFEDTLFEYSGDEIYYRDVTFKELKGPSPDTLDAFSGVGSSSTSHNSSCVWQKHLITAIDEDYRRPMKIYKDENDDFQLRNVSLPSASDVSGLNSAISLANSLRSSYNAHVGDLAEHLVSSGGAAGGADGFDTMIALCNELRLLYVAHEADARAGTPTYHQATIVAADTLENNDAIATLDQAIAFLNDLQAKYNAHDARAVAHTTGGLHQNAGTAAARAFTVTPEAANGASYIYAVVFKYSYNIGSVLYIDRSAPLEVLVTNAGDFTTAANGNDLSNIPEFISQTFSSTVLENWDWQNTVVEIYRTTNGGQTLYKVAEIPNGTNTYDDGTTDADLVFGEVIYTDSGALPNDEVPRCKYVVQANDVIWYLGVKEESEERPFRVRHSHQFIPGGCPSTYRVDVDDDITGGGAVGINPIVFTRDKTYRFEGIVDRLGRGFVKKRIVDDTVGCVSHNSIVSVQEGLYFAALDGFYFTDGFKTQKISEHLNETYSAFVATQAKQKRIYGVHDPRNNLIYWAAQADSADTENNIIFVHDTSWGLRNGSEGTFTTWSYGDNGFPTALEVIDGNLIRADSRGYTFAHDNALYTDLIVDTASSTADWEKKAVIYDYISSAFSFGTELQRKWVTRLLTVLKLETNLNLQPKSINDDSGASNDLKLIRTSSIFEWGDPIFEWGDPEFVWDAPATISAIRHFPVPGLRCTFKQVRYTNAYAIITNSDDLGSVTIDNTANTVTLAAGSFPDDLTNFEIFFSGSSTGYTISSHTSTVLTVVDSLNNLTSGANSDWIIKGYRHGERFHLDSYTMVYDYFGESNRPYRTGDAGENVA